MSPGSESCSLVLSESEVDAFKLEFESVPEVSAPSKSAVEVDAMRSALMTKRSCAYDIPLTAV